MNHKEVKIITEYISVWMWHLIGVIMICFFILLYLIQERVFALGFLVGWGYAEYVSYKRRKELYEQ